MRGILESSQVFRWQRTQLHIAPEGLAVTQRRGPSPTAELKGVVEFKNVISADVVENRRRSWRRQVMLRIQFLDGSPAWEMAGVAEAEAQWAAELIRAQIALLHRARSPEFQGALPLADLQRHADRILVVAERAVVDVVDFILFQAAYHRASDVHFDCTPDGMTVSLRIDGVSRDVLTLSLPWRERVINRLKVAAAVSAFREDVPQEGRMTLNVADRNLDLRLTSMPTLHGERVAVRVLDPAVGLLTLDQLGMSAHTMARAHELLSQPQGLVLLTGPAGCGKSTTLYAALRWIHDHRGDVRTLATVEDPVEFDLRLGNQTQVNPAAGLTFDVGLRTALRQDAQVIMVGEVRDLETAQTAVRAGLTGHLILSTLHARSAAGAFVRLLDLGIEPYLLASSISAVITQRLVRTLCPQCRGTKCAYCHDTGYFGRTALFEILPATDDIHQLTMKRAPLGEFERTAAAMNLPTLCDDGLAKVAAGATTEDELRRVGVLSI